MTGRASHLLQEALQLPEDERAELASSLLESLDPQTHEGVQEAWNEEVAKRIGELDSGCAETVPWPEVLRRLTSKLPDAK